MQWLAPKIRLVAEKDLPGLQNLEGLKRKRFVNHDLTSETFLFL
jgi:hypothetical protein